MNFFIPGADESSKDNCSIKVWQTIKSFLADQGYKTTDRKIQSISYRHNSKDLVNIVGETDPSTGEPVFAIFEADSQQLFYCCTPNRGVFRGMPILIGNEGSKTRPVDFELISSPIKQTIEV